MAKVYKTLTTSELAAELEAVSKASTHVRCRNCTTEYNYGPKVLDGIGSLLCPCGQLREPYDCLTEKWIRIIKMNPFIQLTQVHITYEDNQHHIPQRILNA